MSTNKKAALLAIEHEEAKEALREFAKQCSPHVVILGGRNSGAFDAMMRGKAANIEIIEDESISNEMNLLVSNREMLIKEMDTRILHQSYFNGFPNETRRERRQRERRARR